MSVDSLDGVDLWTMSPPCQPFTKTHGAHQRDVNDKRCAGFLFLISILPKLKQPPRWILLENVAGFVGSEAMVLWRAVLKQCGYTVATLLLSPIDIG